MHVPGIGNVNINLNPQAASEVCNVGWRGLEGSEGLARHYTTERSRGGYPIQNSELWAFVYTSGRKHGAR